MLSALPSHPDTGDRLGYALAYIERGFAVVPLYWMNPDGTCGCGQAHDGSGNLSANSRGKHPHGLFAPHGSLSASKDPDVVRRWFTTETRLNIGIATGEISGLVAVDIDPRDGGDETWEHFVDRNGGSIPDTVIADTGGGGQHVLFRYMPDQVIRSPGKGVQIKGNGGYIVVEPSLHHCGRHYSWRAEADPLDGAEPAEAPEWLVTPKTADLLKPVKGGGRMTGFIPQQQLADLRSALACLDPDPYETWVQVGMAIHSTEAAEAFDLWDAWSQRSSKYNPAAQAAKWRSFHAGNGLHVESVFAWAMTAGWSGETERAAVPAESVKFSAPPQSTWGQSAGDFGLHELPGVLGDVVRFANATAPQPQPDFAVSAALALGSVIAGRRYIVVPRNNFTSLYFVNVGKSASGKEHARTIIDTVLEAAEWPDLIGPGGYSSDSAVFSSLFHQPVHLAIIDEIGALLGNSQSEGMHYARAAMTALVEAWGVCHRSMRPKANSTLGLSKDQADALLGRVVHNPAITLLGMTTPKTFYGSLTESAIEGGFLSRLIIVQTDIGRQPLQNTAPLNVPQSVVDWVKTSRFHAAGNGNLAGIQVGANIRPTLTPIPTDDAATRAFAAYADEARRGMDTLDDEGLAELEGRSAEKAMRVAGILAVSVRPIEPRVDRDLAEYAIRYIRHWTGRTIEAVREYMHGSRFAQWQAEILRCIRNGGTKGRTDRDLCKFNRSFNGLEPRQRKSVLDSLIAKGEIALVESGGLSGRGRKRVSWVAVEPDDDD